MSNNIAIAMYGDSRGYPQLGFNMSAMMDTLPEMGHRPHPQVSHQNDRFAGAMGGMSPYGLPNFPAPPYPIRTPQYPAPNQGYGQMQAPERSFTGAPSPLDSSFFQNIQLPYMYYSGQPSLSSHYPMTAPYNQQAGQEYGVEHARRLLHTGYGPNSRPG